MNTFPSIPVTNQHVRTIAEFLTGASQRILKACVLLARYRGFPENETTSLYQKISVPLYDHLQKDFQQNECELILDSLMSVAQFEDFASDRKAVHRFISNTEYVDLDMPMDTGFVDTLDYFSDEVEGVLPEDDVLDVGVSDRYNRVV